MKKLLTILLFSSLFCAAQTTITRSALKAKTTTATSIYKITEKGVTTYWQQVQGDYAESDSVIRGKKIFVRLVPAVQPKPVVVTPVTDGDYVGTVSLNTDKISTGGYAANSLSPDFNNGPGTKSIYGLTPASQSDYLVQSKHKSRDVEVEFTSTQAWVLLRVNEEQNLGIYFLVTNGYYSCGVVKRPNVLEGDVYGDGNTANYPEGQVPLHEFYDAFYPDIKPAKAVKGDGSGKFTVGCEGLDVYAKYNGVEFYRRKQVYVTGAGYTGIKRFDNTTALQGTITIKHKARVNLLSNTDDGKINVVDLGCKSANTTGSMSITGNPYLLTVKDASKYKVGDRLIVTIGHENIVQGRPPPATRGALGVGGNWPQKYYPNLAALQATTGTRIDEGAWVEDTRLTYKWDGAAWKQLYGIGYMGETGKPFETGIPYENYTVPKSYRGVIVAVNGNVLVMDTPCINSTTNANVYFDNIDFLNLQTTGSALVGLSSTPKLYFPAGTFAVSEAWNVIDCKGWSILGAGKDSTTLVSPSGCPSVSLHAGGSSSNLEIKDFTMVGSGRKNGFGFNWWQKGWLGPTYEESGITATTEYYSDYSKGLMLDGNNCHVQNVRVVDAFASAFQMSGTDCLIEDWECIHTTGTWRYMEWLVGNASHAARITYKRGYFWAAEMVSAIESFGTDDIVVDGLVMVNGRNSSNGGRNMIIRNADITITAGSIPAWMTPGEPVITFNQNNGYGAGAGGTLDNVTMTWKGFSDPWDNKMIIGVVVNDGNDGVVIKNCRFVTDSSIRNDVRTKLCAISSTGTNVTVDNVVAIGHNLAVGNDYDTNASDNNIYLSSGTISNTKATSVSVLSGVALLNNQVEWLKTIK